MNVPTPEIASGVLQSSFPPANKLKLGELGLRALISLGVCALGFARFLAEAFFVGMIFAGEALCCAYVTGQMTRKAKAKRRRGILLGCLYSVVERISEVIGFELVSARRTRIRQ